MSRRTLGRKQRKAENTLHRSESGLLVGIQLVAGYGREDILIRVSSQLEEAQPWDGLWVFRSNPLTLNETSQNQMLSG